MSKLVVNTIEPQVGFTSVTFNTNINTTSFNVTGISTFANIDINGSLDLDGTLNVTGVSTIGVSDKQIIFTTDGGLGAIQSASSSGFKIQRGTTDTININSGQVTIANHNLKVNNNSIVGSAITMYGATGIVSATAFYGDGSALTGIVSIPTGVIVMWSGAVSAIPSGWVICDGTNSTPDLRDRFIVGAHSDGASGVTFDGNSGVVSGNYAPGNTGGSVAHQLTEAEMPSHSHTYSRASSPGGGQDQAGSGSGDAVNQSNQYTSSVGGNDYHENRPPYYALAYIMKT